MAPDHFFGKLVSDLLNTATSGCAFGEPVKYFPKNAVGSFTVQAIFDGPFEEVDPDTETTISSNQFSLGLKLSDLPSPPEKYDRVQVREVNYRVIDAQEDGQGGVELLLHKVDS